MKMPQSDPAYHLLTDGFTSTPDSSVYTDTCYICRDPEYAQMGLPLCYACLVCGGHVAADDTRCDKCGVDQQDLYMMNWGTSGQLRAPAVRHNVKRLKEVLK